MKKQQKFESQAVRPFGYWPLNTIIVKINRLWRFSSIFWKNPVKVFFSHQNSSLGTATGIRCLPKYFWTPAAATAAADPETDPRCEKNHSSNSILTPVTSFGSLFLGHVYVMARLRLSSRMLKRLSLWATLATYIGVLRQNRPTYGISHVVIDLINNVMKNSYPVRD